MYPKSVRTINIGDQFERLTVIAGPIRIGKTNQRAYTCRCSCGSEKVFQAQKLYSGHTRSCGCLRIDEQRERSITHGKSKCPEYPSWAAMKARCLNPDNWKYCDYGGRGITICERWLGKDGLVNFRSDMGDRPSRNHSIDRIDPNGNYEPSNCRWATHKQQMNNRRNTVLITHLGKTQSAMEWHRETGIPYTTLLTRLKSGLPVSEILAR